MPCARVAAAVCSMRATAMAHNLSAVTSSSMWHTSHGWDGAGAGAATATATRVTMWNGSGLQVAPWSGSGLGQKMCDAPAIKEMTLLVNNLVKYCFRLNPFWMPRCCQYVICLCYNDHCLQDPDEIGALLYKVLYKCTIRDSTCVEHLPSK